MAGRFDLGAVARSLLQRKRLLAVLALVLLAFGALRAYETYIGGPLVELRGGVLFVSMHPDAPWVSSSVRAALEIPAPVGEAGPVEWRTLAPGFEIGELPVRVRGAEVDRLYLTRIDPAHFTFEVRSDPSSSKDLNAWMRDLGAVAVINGSYYADHGGPSTPVRIDGAWEGPRDYDSQHGAFAAWPARAEVIDIAGADWRTALGDAEAAMISYPLLVAPDGANRAPQSRWLASRSFVGQDSNGFIVLGAAPEGFFSLYRLGEFLRTAPLDLVTALNLDGGPVACFGVEIGGVRRMTYGHVEMQIDEEGGPVRAIPARRDIHAVMPLVLAVFPRAEAS